MSASIVPLSGLTLNMIGEGTLADSFNVELQKVVHDLDSRGSDGKIRKITLTLELSKVGGQVKINPAIQTNLPKVLPAITMGSIRFDPNTKQSVIVFSAYALNMDQKTIDDALEEHDRRANPNEYRPGDNKPNGDRPSHPELDG